MSLTTSNLFWASLAILIYTYLGYGIILWIVTKIRGHRKVGDLADELLPDVTHLVAAYNEEEFIEQKIINSLGLDYPPDRLHLFIVTDGSTDGTKDIVQRYKHVKHFHVDQRSGKIHAVSRAMKFVESPIVVFSDANTTLNEMAIRKIVRHYSDERTGGVAGEKRIVNLKSDNASGSGEGLYWKYESALKRMDSALNSVVGAAGELFSIRTSLYEEPAPNMLIEDFYISMKIASRGYRFAYEPEAYAIETAAANVGEEWKRKVRITAGGFQAMLLLTGILNPFRYGVLSFQYFSHRVLRWTLAPLSLVALLISSIILSMRYPWSVYGLGFLMQAGFYGMAMIGHWKKNAHIRIKGFFVPYYFSVMNLAVFAGLFKFISGKQSVIWEKAKRAKNPAAPSHDLVFKH